MDCTFTEKVSLLIDGELNESEARQTERHLASCAVCRQAQEDFLRLRQKIQAYPLEPDLQAQQRAINHILKARRPSVWRRRIALPVPALALLALLFIALSVWAISLRLSKPAPQTTRVQIVKPEDLPPTPATVYDLSRFDKGERPVIYTSRRASAVDARQ
jgi:anti-sigma factor RsiW